MFHLVDSIFFRGAIHERWGLDIRMSIFGVVSDIPINSIKHEF